MLRYIQSFPKGLEPERGVHRPDQINYRTIAAYCRDRRRAPLRVRIRLRLARVSIGSQVCVPLRVALSRVRRRHVTSNV